MANNNFICGLENENQIRVFHEDTSSFNFEEDVVGQEPRTQLAKQLEEQPDLHIVQVVCPPEQTIPHQQVRHQEQENLDQLKTKRLISIFSLWRSKTEMQRNMNTPPQVEINAHPIPLATGRHSTCSHGFRRNQHMFVPTCASNIPFATNVAPANLNEAISEKKLWQSLVMPIILGCIIFLIALWTRQISLVLVNDTIVMIIILAAVFIIMSGFAFWFAQDQQFGDRSIREEEQQQDIHQHHHRLSIRNANHETHCPRLMINRQAIPDPSGGEASKCCGIAIIDCQPPDYYSAMRNSIPLDLNYEDDKQQLVRLDIQHHIEHEEEPQNSPPKYNDLNIDQHK